MTGWQCHGDLSYVTYVFWQQIDIIFIVFLSLCHHHQSHPQYFKLFLTKNRHGFWLYFDCLLSYFLDHSQRHMKPSKHVTSSSLIMTHRARAVCAVQKTVLVFHTHTVPPVRFRRRIFLWLAKHEGRLVGHRTYIEALVGTATVHSLICDSVTVGCWW